MSHANRRSGPDEVEETVRSGSPPIAFRRTEQRRTKGKPKKQNYRRGKQVEQICTQWPHHNIYVLACRYILEK
jgi:hypothetical protein